VSKVVYEDENAKCVQFFLKGGQSIRLHSSPSSVFITVLKGSLEFMIGNENTKQKLSSGDTIFYAPEEPHGFVALEDSAVQAVIAPKPVRKIKL
jgi:quercetin dioxygenase-like cupin family protein